MLVKYWMRTPAVTVDADARLAEAERLMHRQGIRMLPVVAGGRLVGVITRAALERILAGGPETAAGPERAAAVAGIRVQRAMILDPVRIPLYHTVEEAAVALLENGVRAAPVTDPAGGVAGVVSATDLFRALAQMIGVRRKGIQVALRTTDRPGAVQEVADRIQGHRGRIVSILTRRGASGDEDMEVYFRVRGLERGAIHRLMDSLRALARVAYVVDHEAAEREIASETPLGPTAAPGPQRSAGASEKGDYR